MRLESLNDRVYFAFHCLPRPLPSWKKFEDDNGLPLAVMSKLASGERSSVDHGTLLKLAAALGDWIIDGKGKEPTLTGPMEPRKVRFAEIDLAAWAVEYERCPDAFRYGIREFPNSFEEAVAMLREELSDAAIKSVREEAAGREFERRPIFWAQRLVHVECERRVALMKRIEAERSKPTPPSGTRKSSSSSRIKAVR